LSETIRICRIETRFIEEISKKITSRSIKVSKGDLGKVKEKVKGNKANTEVTKGTGDDVVTYRRVQGEEGTKSSQQRIQVNEDGTVTIPKKKILI